MGLYSDQRIRSFLDMTGSPNVHHPNRIFDWLSCPGREAQLHARKGRGRLSYRPSPTLSGFSNLPAAPTVRVSLAIEISVPILFRVCPDSWLNEGQLVSRHNDPSQGRDAPQYIVSRRFGCSAAAWSAIRDYPDTCALAHSIQWVADVRLTSNELVPTDCSHYSRSAIEVIQIECARSRSVPFQEAAMLILVTRSTYPNE